MNPTAIFLGDQRKFALCGLTQEEIKIVANTAK